ncbi:MAG TPA: methyltransferase domain-containing protein [Anaerolineae bacterium]|nr:methyltransferase domain-containing protein [Anaerolineae bacterium]
MPDSNTIFSESIPENYDRYLGPTMFETYAADLANRVAANSNGAVLETACGTGILTQALRARLPLTTPIVATDIGQAMLDYARKKLGDLQNVEWKQADATVLPFPSASFGAVACQFGVMFFPDKLAAFKEARRVLTDNGAFYFNVWGDMAHNPAASLAHGTLSKIFPDNPPNFYTVPFGFNDREVLRSLLTNSGFRNLEFEEIAMEVSSPSAKEYAIGYLAGTPASTAIRERGGNVDEVVDTLTKSFAQLGGEAPFRAPMHALVITAHA